MEAMAKKNRNIMHVELTPRLRDKLDAIAMELRKDPRLEGAAITRQTALRHAVNAYEMKGEANGAGG